ncbi:nucleotidyltransferase domain-containing protein [Candidatus Poribacteria bacterium]|nr:nucleotidyltransferase domain-containing protein [Candidatus Poribacteria bacterium]
MDIGESKGKEIFQPLTEELLGEIVRRIVEGAHPERIILFGSHAYGTPTRDSDVDLIVVKRDVVSKRKESVRIRKLLRGILLPFDIIVVRPEEFEFYKDEPGSVFKEAFRKGVVIYDAETMADLPSKGRL